jgi:ATP-dependent exoDNAse (exonuclease V) alpha subunit
MFLQSDIIIIDEISMVRADTLDAVDTILKRITRKNLPFGGKKVLMVGDVFQLEPIVKGIESGLLAEHYQSPFFFHSQVLTQNQYDTFKLKKIYRQSDERFLGLLNTVKMGESDEYTLEGLNDRVTDANEDIKSIYLCARKAEAEAINNERMNALPSESRSYSGRVSGEFGTNILPNDILLELKPEARVMFLKNDPEKRFVNGTLGTVTQLHSQTISIETDEGERVEMEPETWENIKYSYDEKENTISENVMGSFEQFAIKPAWAITIHKSQGLTFDQVNINLGAGAFASGMLYVALSRCRTLEFAGGTFY